MFVRAAMALVLTVAFVTPLLAGDRTPGVDRRQHRQKERIKQGVRSGEITKEEAKALRQEGMAIREKEKAFKSDGVVTREERRELHQDLNERSKHIVQEKHDAETR